MAPNIVKYAGAALLTLAAMASASTIELNEPNACAPVVVTPCMAAGMTGPVLITNPSQIAYVIADNGSYYVGQTDTASAVWLDANTGLHLPADPNQAVAENAAAVAALLANSAPVGTATNPGGSTVVTNSVSSYFSGFADTPVTQRVDGYQTTIEAVLNRSQSVFEESFSAPFADPTVQAAIAQAQAILAGDNGTYGSPSLVSNSTSLVSSVLSYVTTGQSATLDVLVTTIDTFGPNYVAVGDNQSLLFPISPGQLDINVNTQYFYLTDRNAITTNTYQTSQTYLINGATLPAGAVPEPSAWLLCGLGLLAALWRKLSACRANGNLESPPNLHPH